ncbi:UNVERIFIED_CONTAM: putative tRNA pseudouridine synthase Pus10 [Siphonaria sp. JEL0065]|nr:putative tRNA pseudouridine synthase Pus10 [Siphonaria sp. JEL0065]
MINLSPTILAHLPSSAINAAQQLTSQSVCRVCVPRILGVRKMGLFEQLSSSSTISDEDCVACLGLLSNKTLTKTVTESASIFFRDEWRGASSFGVSVRVPVQLALRAHVLGLDFENGCFKVALQNGGKKSKTLKDPKKALHVRPDAAATLQRNPVLIDSLDNQEFRIMPNQIEVKDVLKHLLVTRLQSALPNNLKFDSSSDLLLEIGYDHPPSDSEYEFMVSIEKCGLQVRKSRKLVRYGSVVREMGDDEEGNTHIEGARWDHLIKAASQLSKFELVEAGYLPLKKTSSPCVLREFRFLHASLWIAGRYNKYQRTISNSRMEYNGTRLAPESVEELIAVHIDKFFRSDTHRFSSSGREDVDVLMLGTGRPFYIEIVNPRVLDASRGEVKALQDFVNDACVGKVQVSDLQLVGKRDTRHLKDSASTKKKSYSTLVRLSSPVSQTQLDEISNLKNLELKQQTPVRVQNSRSDLTRDKVIHEMKASFVECDSDGDPNVSIVETERRNLVRLDLVTSAGTYVKEFVHGDGGRTVPSLKELLSVDAASVVSLDVLHVYLDWPPPLGAE